MKTRFLQLEDQAQRLKASLQIGAEHMKAVQAQTDDAASEVIIGLMAGLRITDEEYAILKLRRLFGPISVTPGKARVGPSLKWENAPGRMHKRQALTSEEGHAMEGPQTAETDAS